MDPQTGKDQLSATQNGTYWAAARLLAKVDYGKDGLEENGGKRKAASSSDDDLTILNASEKCQQKSFSTSCCPLNWAFRLINDHTQGTPIPYK